MEYRRNLPYFQPGGAERDLECSKLGPAWLKEPPIAKCVTQIIRDGDQVRALYNLIAFVVTPNHVHLLIEPKVPAPKITQ